MSDLVTEAELYNPVTNTWSPAGNLTASRIYHTATLLPDGQVLITGGYYMRNEAGYLASAELYDPATNTWSAAGSLNVARFGHTATLLADGRVMVVGGESSGSYNYLASVELYDPATNTWSAAASLSTGRVNHTATLLSDGRVLVAGGTSPVPSYLDSVELYDPTTNTWSAAASLNTYRQGHTATLLVDGRVLVAGGNDSYNRAELYDPGNNAWTPTATTLTPAWSSHTATLLADGLVLFVAGWSNGSYGSYEWNSRAELYDSTTNTWYDAGILTNARTFHTATLLPNGRVLVAGGWITDAVGIDTGIASAELYDPADGTWSFAASLPAYNRFQSTATLLSNGRVLIAGGWTPVNRPSSAILYDPATNTQSSAGDLNTARSSHTATLLPNGQVLYAGGYGGTNRAVYHSTVTSELYDSATNTWSAAANLDPDRADHAATLLPDGRVLVTGGKSGIYTLTSADLYDPATDTWSNARSFTISRWSHTATLLSDGQVLITGGTCSTGEPRAISELYNPATNTWTDAGSLADARWGHTSTLLPDGRVLVAGGYNGTGPLASVELYDPATNTWSVANSLSDARYYHTATLLPDGRVLVAGGTSSYVLNVPGTGSLESTEIYDPSTDTWSAAASLDHARLLHSTTLLPDGTVLVAWGSGSYDTNDLINSTELYDTGLGFDNGWRPSIESIPSPIPANKSFSITGNGFRGVGNTEASSGGTNSSATNFPLVLVQSAGNEQLQWIKTQNFTATSSTVEPIKDFPAGPAWITVIVNGIPSVAKYVVIPYIPSNTIPFPIPNPIKLNNFPWLMFVPAITNNSRK